MVTLPTSAATARGKVPESLDPKGVYLSRVLATESWRRTQTVKGNVVDQTVSLDSIPRFVDDFPACTALNLKVSDCASQYTPNARSNGK